jgi:hypothetical protein
VPCTAAGCVFTDGTHILAGYQPLKKRPYISGFGGKRKEGETVSTTAIREMLEEVFEFDEIPSALVCRIKEIPPAHILENGAYVLFVYSFRDLELILEFASSYRSPLYAVMPRTLIDLVSLRLITPQRGIISQRYQEITHLALLPFVEGVALDSAFVSDITLILQAMLEGRSRGIEKITC